MSGLGKAKAVVELSTITWAWIAFDWKTALLVFLALLTSNIQANFWSRKRR